MEVSCVPLSDNTISEILHVKKMQRRFETVSKAAVIRITVTSNHLDNESTAIKNYFPSQGPA